jgi:hypothetical protein
MLAYGPNSTEVICVISPEAMLHIAEAGWSRRRVAEFLHENTHLPASEWSRWRRLEPAENSDRLIPVVADADRITVLPGGGMAGAFVSLINTWGSSRSVTRQVAVPKI